MNITKLIIAGALVLSTASFCAYAKEGKAGKHASCKGSYTNMLATYDTNKDGMIDDTEKAAMPKKLQKHFTKMMEKYDINKDGKLDDSELAAMKAAKKAAKKNTKPAQ